MVIQISPKNVLRVLVYIITTLGVINLGLALLRIFTGHGRLWGIGPLFNSGLESNIPTWYSTLALFIAAVLLAVVYVIKKNNGGEYVPHWKWMSILFLYLSIDEGCMLHERIGNVFIRLEQGRTISHMGWTAPFVVPVVAIGVLYIRFLRDLPAKTRRLFILSGVLYVGSALGLELIGGLFSTALGQTNIISTLLNSVEEPGEMLGVATLIYAILSYMSEQTPTLRITIGAERVAAYTHEALREDDPV